MANYKHVFEDGYSYFITIVTHMRNPILIQNIELLRESFRVSKLKYNYNIDAIVIMPDHLHMIITPQCAKEYPHIVRTIKQHFSKYCDPKYYAHLQQSHSRRKEGYLPVWQKKYYEHTLRDAKDFKLHLDYIHFNPVKHNVADSVGDWEYSSFQKYVDLGEYHSRWCDFSADVDFE
ncbi:REP-associated tyrosine transposase [Sulfurovum riftiae]|uniref:Transposase IS200-like domain-containing protein n=1 Tax=Sulfurovum riftiae TaxID=1630136 RepID=A0A151CF26_9BACT|nr:transposase [Sulfurovum riftiae]KYJ86074.1 hypothetical protein AS592_01520 [Sulfurovum riftiae]